MKHLLFFSLIYIESVFAKDVIVSLPHSLPPWVIDDRRGLALELVRDTLQQAGYGFMPIFVPLQRLDWALHQSNVDAIAMVENQAIKQVFYSHPIGAYEAIIVTLRSKRITLSSVSKLENLIVISFKGSTEVFPVLASVANKSDNFLEVTDQQGQVSMLFKRRADAIILDRNLFEYWTSQNTDALFRQEVDIIPLNRIIPASHTNPIFVVFKEQIIREQFNAALAEMRSNGRFKQIYAEYLRR
ncbi:substrate-binding periplasmic protein [Pseudoalteromonas sp. S16_S37]|uniref:substrate-binding periplasmic protein n=1 Tax=Pseudoalteromonas sp. S16_S37 TaxID=2720228 RepID=UPI001681B90A|nr:transporter substrate-binding domain-containing protein [Pseudoalteromonas sp. S16_S37]MBD1584535.1 amino acid ABC transporter substrate-binding protein [Pseudoalteromonas sp. S16_S37]